MLCLNFPEAATPTPTKNEQHETWRSFQNSLATNSSLSYLKVNHFISPNTLQYPSIGRGKDTQKIVIMVVPRSSSSCPTLERKTLVIDAEAIPLCPFVDNGAGSPSKSSASGTGGFMDTIISDAWGRNHLVKRREASKRAREKLGSTIAAVTTFLIFTWAIRSCIPPEVTTWHRQHQEQNVNLRSSSSSFPTPTHDMPSSDVSQRHRRLMESPRRQLRHMEYAHNNAPSDLKKLHKKMTYSDPRTTAQRKAMPLDANAYKLNPLAKPDGYPWHRWAKSTTSPVDHYPLNATKFIHVLSQLGQGHDTLGTVTPNNYTVGGVKLTPDTIRLGPHVRPYIIKDGTVLRPEGRTGMFVTLVQQAVELAATLVDESPRMKILTKGSQPIPLIFDSNDYPWCGDDLVPIFRLNAIKERDCKHSWPVMSLTYFQDPTNIQLAESPYQWDTIMEGYDTQYPWERKMNKVVWRGRITGYTYPDGERPRQELVRYSRDHLDIMDIKPSTKKSKMDQDDFQKYKAILDIDGNAWSARLGKLMCYNSVVIKVDGDFVGYWEKELEPWVHYIPVESDFSNLAQTVRYVVDPVNSEQMQQIVKNSQQFCRTKLTMEQYTVDILWTLLAYAELIQGSPDFHTEWKKNSDAYNLPVLEMAPWRARGKLQQNVQ